MVEKAFLQRSLLLLIKTNLRYNDDDNTNDDVVDEDDANVYYNDDDDEVNSNVDGDDISCGDVDVIMCSRLKLSKNTNMMCILVKIMIILL